MDIRESILNHAQLVDSNAGKVTNEPDTKRVLVIPFLEDVLGTNSRDPHEMKSEYPADWGDRNHKAVDYALMFDDKPLVIIEAKRARKSLEGEPLTQLRGYFSVIPEARIGILTDGIKYRFYADLDDSKGLDSVPFLEIDFSRLDESLAPDIAHFHKDGFDADRILAWARDSQERRMWQSAIGNQLQNEMAEPSDQFVKFMMDRVGAGRKSQARIGEFRGYIKSAVSELDSVGPGAGPNNGNGSGSLVARLIPLPDYKAKQHRIPRQMQFPGQDHPEDVEGYHEMWKRVAKWLYGGEGSSKHPPLPVRTKRNQKVVVDSTDEHMTKPFPIREGELYIENDANSEDCIRWAVLLLEKHEQEPSTVRILPRT